MAFLGIDLGSSSIKFGLLDPETLHVDGMFSMPFPEPVPGLGPGRFEVEPSQILAAVRSGLTRMDAATQGTLEGIVGSCQMGGLIAIDGQGRPLTRYLSWRDQRSGLPGSGGALHASLGLSGSPCETTAIDLVRDLLIDEQLRSIGNELRLGSMLVLAALLVARGELTATATPLTLGDYVLVSLGQAIAATERTCALGTLDLKQQDFARQIQTRLGIAHLNWPKLVDAHLPLGQWQLENGRVIPWYPFIGDHQASLLGVDLAPGDLSINVSTGSQVAVLSASPDAANFQVRPYFEGRFLRTITHLPAGRALQAWVDLLSELAAVEGIQLQDPWGSIARLTEQTQRQDLDMDLMLHDGPVHHRGSVTGLTLENLRIGPLFLAAFEDMADRYRDCAARLIASEPPQRLILSGGLVRRLPRLQAAITQRFSALPVLMPESSESALEGLARLAQKIKGSALASQRRP